MQTVTYKPFKKRPSEWQSLDDRNRKTPSGREEWCVEIGIRKFTDSETGEEIKTEPVTEYVYKDILLNIFDPKSAKDFDVRINLGYAPQLTILCNNRLVLHNEKMWQDVDKINKYINGISVKKLIPVVVNSVLNYYGAEKQTEYLKDFMGEVNTACDGIFPADMIGAVVREYVCETRRNLDGVAQDIHFMGYADLMNAAQAALEKNDSNVIAMIKEELFYAFLLGDNTPRDVRE